MNRRKMRQAQMGQEMQCVLKLIDEHPDGILSADVASALGLSGRATTRLLIALRERGLAYSHLPDPTKRIYRWMKTPAPGDDKYDPPYPALDAEHVAWRAKILAGKPVYNPWSRV